MLCVVFLALLGSALAAPVDVEAGLMHNVDLGRLQKDLAALDESLTNTAAVEAEIERLKAAYEKTVIESPEALNGSTFEDEDINQLNEKDGLEKDLFEGDIILTNEQLALIEKSNRSRRQAFEKKSRCLLEPTSRITGTSITSSRNRCVASISLILSHFLQAPRGMRVQMTPKILSVRWSNSCKYSGIEVKFLKDARLTGLQLCDSRIRLPTLTSATNEMLVQAYSMGDKFEVELQFKAIK